KRDWSSDVCSSDLTSKNRFFRSNRDLFPFVVRYRTSVGAEVSKHERRGKLADCPSIPQGERTPFSRFASFSRFPVGGAEAPTGNAARHYLSRTIRLIAASAAPTIAGHVSRKWVFEVLCGKRLHVVEVAVLQLDVMRGRIIQLPDRARIQLADHPRGIAHPQLAAAHALARRHQCAGGDEGVRFDHRAVQH